MNHYSHEQRMILIENSIYSTNILMSICSRNMVFLLFSFYACILYFFYEKLAKNQIIFHLHGFFNFICEHAVVIIMLTRKYRPHFSKYFRYILDNFYINLLMGDIYDFPHICYCHFILVVVLRYIFMTSNYFISNKILIGCYNDTACEI